MGLSTHLLLACLCVSVLQGYGLMYRGYTIVDLAKNCVFEEVSSGASSGEKEREGEEGKVEQWNRSLDATCLNSSFACLWFVAPLLASDCSPADLRIAADGGAAQGLHC